MRPSSKGNNTKLSDFLKCQLWGRIDLKNAYQKHGICRIHHKRKQNRKKIHLSSNEQEKKKEYDLMYSIKICLY